MIRKYHNHKLQTNPWHREDEPHNNHEPPGRQTKRSNQLCVPRQSNVKQNVEQLQTCVARTPQSSTTFLRFF